MHESKPILSYPWVKICLFKSIANSKIFHFKYGFQGRSRFSGIINAAILAKMTFKIFENNEKYYSHKILNEK